MTSVVNPHEPTKTWEEAIAALTYERTLVEAGAGLLKKYGAALDVDAGLQKYTQAKAEYDAIIAGLSVALAQDAEPDTLASLETRMHRAYALRQEFSADVNRTLPPRLQGAKDPTVASIVEGLGKALVGPLVEAVKAIWFRHKDDNALRRATIRTQLDACKWRNFNEIPAAAD